MTTNTASTDRVAAAPIEDQTRHAQPTITVVYTLPDCVQCDATKRALDKAGIEYQVIDLSTDPTARAVLHSAEAIA